MLLVAVRGAFAGVGSDLLVGNRAEYDGQGGTGVVYEFDVHTGALIRTFVNPVRLRRSSGK